MNNTVPVPVKQTLEKEYSIMMFGYKMDFYTIGFVIVFLIYYISFFIYGGYSFSKINYLWNRLISTSQKSSGKPSVQKGTKWSITSL